MSADRLKVKRDGPRGWHWIAASSFDPAVHELVDPPPAPPAAEPAPAPEQKSKGGKAAKKE